MDQTNIIKGIIREENYAYKFRNINDYFVSSIKNSELFFASPKDLNDPFDCQISIKTALKNAIAASSGAVRKNLKKLILLRPFFEDFQERLCNVGVCSFAGEIMNPLMWAHYADDHKGVCLLYNFPGSFVADERNDFIGLTAAEYRSNALTEWFKTIALQLPHIEFDKFRNELLFKIIAIKDKCWEYEKEGRLVKNGAGLLKIDKSFLIQIIFGMNSSPSDIIMLKKMLKDCGYKVTTGQIVKSNDDFGLDAVEIP
jgi:hypothetical protein